jgi:Saccharopine dehydrogenase NADP binding domain
MEGKSILILGGYGNTGRLLARLLLQESNARIVLAGRNIDRAKQLAEELSHGFESDRVTGVYADASDLQSLHQVLAGIDLILVAASTIQYTPQVARAALEAGTGYMDIQYSTQKIRFLRSLADEIRKAGSCFITDGGFHPGLPAFLVRYAAQSFDHLVTARVGSVIKQDWQSLKVEESTVVELLELMNDYEMSIFKNGAWKKVSLVGMSDYIHMDFGGEFGRQYCAPMLLEEMRALPENYPSLKDTGFYVGSFNWFVDWIILPLAMVAMKIWPHTAVRPMSRWMLWGLQTYSRPPYGTLLRVEATGEVDRRTRALQLTISHKDGYMFTAIPVVSCLLQYLDGSINKTGLWLQAHIVEPNRFMCDMQRMGIAVHAVEGGIDEVAPG